MDCKEGISFAEVISNYLNRILF